MTSFDETIPRTFEQLSHQQLGIFAKELHEHFLEERRLRQELEQRYQALQRAEETILALSTPVLPIGRHVLLLPIIGLINPERAQQSREQLLGAIRTARAKAVVIDVTGVAEVDPWVASHMAKTVEACRLLGARVIVTGISPQIARALVETGTDLNKFHTAGDLRSGVEEAERATGEEPRHYQPAPGR